MAGVGPLLRQEMDLEVGPGRSGGLGEVVSGGAGCYNEEDCDGTSGRESSGVVGKWVVVW